MPDNDNFGGTTLTGEHGEQMDPAIAGISPPDVLNMQSDAAGPAVAADLDDEDAAGADVGNNDPVGADVDNGDPVGADVGDNDAVGADLEDGKAAQQSVDAGIADETAGYDKAMTPTEGGSAADESESQPS